MNYTKTTELTFDEALALLDKGNAIRLPEWEGYWFNGVRQKGEPSQVLVFTKHGDILDTPHIAKHQHRTDWQVADPEKLDFGFAVRALKNGKRVTRRGWNGEGMYLTMMPGYPDGVEVNEATQKAHNLPAGTKLVYRPYFQLFTAQKDVAMWSPSGSDALAEDWVIIQ